MFEALTLVLLMAAGGADPAAQTPPARPADPTSHVVDVHGVQLHYVDWGGSGVALLFLPPACETPHICGDIAAAFTDRFRVLGLTTRGCGRSGRAEAYDLDTQLKEVAGFLDVLRIERAVIAGFSASGGKAIRFARVYPSRVSKLVIFDSV